PSSYPDLTIKTNGGLTVATSLKGDERLFLTGWVADSQLLDHLDDDGADTDFVTAIAIQWTHEQRYIPIMGGHQCQHPVFEIGTMIARVAVSDGNLGRFGCFWIGLIGSTDRKGGGIYMHTAAGESKALAGLLCYPGKQGCRIVLADPVQRPT